MQAKWLVFLLTVSACALGQNLLVNGDFESGTTGWTKWWDSGNAGFPVSDPIEGDDCAGIWWSDVGIYQGIPIGPGTYTVSGKMLHLSDDTPLGQNRLGIIQAEVGDGAEIAWTQRITIDQTSPHDQWLSGSIEIDNTAAGATWLNINLFTLDQDGEHTGTGSVRFDDISVTSDDTAPVNSPNYNDDEIVNLLDFTKLAGAWRQDSPTYNLSGAVNIDIEDLALFADAWLTTIPVYDGYELVWSDEFDGSSLNPANWSYDIGNGCPDLCGWGNNELQYYRSQNVSVSDGRLTIEAREQDAGYDYTSGKIHTCGKQDFLYGRIEARIKVPTGGGMWPAFWLMPSDSVYGGWAASGEVDIMETRNETDYIGGTIHYGGQWPDHQHTGGDYAPPGVDFSEDFHVYALQWEPDMMRWYVDGILYSTKTSAQWYSNGAPTNPRAPFDQDFYIIMNTAVGGNYTGCTNSGCISADFPQQMVVDWVRVYQKTVP